MKWRSKKGMQINQNISLAPEASFAPALEDINVYTLDAEILRVTNIRRSCLRRGILFRT